MLSIDIHTRSEYKEGDLAVTEQGGMRFLVEVLGDLGKSYRARLSRMIPDEKTGKYSVLCDRGTFSGVPKKKMRPLRLDEIDFQSLAEWQSFILKGGRLPEGTGTGRCPV